MSIVNLKPKAAPKEGEADNFISKKIKEIGANLKSSPTIISKDLKIEGDLFNNGIIEIEGLVKGSIFGGLVVIREDGAIEGQVEVDSIEIKGRFDGAIKAKAVAIFNGAQVVGSIEYEIISVEDGASIDGQFKMR